MQRSASVTFAPPVSDAGTISPTPWPDGVDTWPPDAPWGPDGHATHTHPFGHLVYAASGGCTLETPGGRHRVDVARAVWVPRDVPHAAWFDPDYFPVVLALRTSGRGPVREIAVCPQVRAQILSGARDDRELPRLLAALVGPDARTAPPTSPAGTPAPAGALTALVAHAFAENPADPRTLEDWSRELHVSAVTIRRAFVTETGMPFSAWRTRTRLDAAVARLRAGEPVTAVAHAVGMSHNGLIAACHRELGLPPSSLRSAGRAT